jgi:hypothetical protein
MFEFVQQEVVGLIVNFFVLAFRYEEVGERFANSTCEFTREFGGEIEPLLLLILYISIIAYFMHLMPTRTQIITGSSIFLQVIRSLNMGNVPNLLILLKLIAFQIRLA